MKFSILTISDSCFLQPENDKGGPLIKELLLKSQKLGSVEIVNHSIVPDDANKISQYLTNQRHFCDVILTTGGTGLSSRDVTPEATRSVIERECNGISTALLIRGLQSTPYAALTRLLAGTIGGCLIINLPGRPKAVSEGFEVLEGILCHAVSLLRGDALEIKKVHSEKT